MQRLFQSFVSLSLIAVLLAAVVWFFHPNRPQATAQSLKTGTVLSTPRNIMPFALTDGNGKSFTDQNLQNKWSFLFFGYTHCPDICPTTLKLLSQASSALRKIHFPVQVVFITLDPKVDNAIQVGGYAKQFDPRFIGVTGSKQEINKLSNLFGITQVKNGMQIDHTGAVVVINPKGQYFGLFSSPTLKGIVNDFPQMVKLG